jgi:hypothetical protein
MGRGKKKEDPQVLDSYILTCLVAGDKNTFSISVPRAAGVEEMTQSIYEKRVSGRFTHSIGEMTFWKVCQDWRAV